MALLIVILHNMTFDLNFFLMVHAFCFQEIFTHTEILIFREIWHCRYFFTVSWDINFIPYIHRMLYRKEHENFDSTSHKVWTYIEVFWVMKLCKMLVVDCVSEDLCDSTFRLKVLNVLYIVKVRYKF